MVDLWRYFWIRETKQVNKRPNSMWKIYDDDDDDDWFWVASLEFAYGLSRCYIVSTTLPWRWRHYTPPEQPNNVPEYCGFHHYRQGGTTNTTHDINVFALREGSKISLTLIRDSSFGESLRAGRSGDRIPVWARFSVPVQICRGAHPASCTVGTGSFPVVKCGRGVALTTHPNLALRLKK